MGRVFVVLEVNQKKLAKRLALLGGSATHVESSALQAVGALLLRALLDEEAMPAGEVTGELDGFGLNLRSSHPKYPVR